MHGELIRLFGLSPIELRVVAGDVGGSFGMKAGLYPETALVVSRRGARRPVRWPPIAPRRFSPTSTPAISRRRWSSRSTGRPFPRASGRLRRQRRRLSLGPLPGSGQQHRRYRGVYATALSLRRSAASLPTRSRWGPIAAPDGRRRAMRSSARSTWRRVSSASTSGAAPAQLGSTRGDALQDRLPLHL